ncbi:hypothetical protein [Kingella potus]|uniref:hypothetical protein n=1 Tax=Kingella potus TaxID=265175 RepID=UPI001FD4E903|nr:hypothetical protein [Kingella potus]UOP00584.1 hypothetical protein LVJ84_12220 [Kingella potus]
MVGFLRADGFQTACLRLRPSEKRERDFSDGLQPLRRHICAKRYGADDTGKRRICRGRLGLRTARCGIFRNRRQSAKTHTTARAAPIPCCHKPPNRVRCCGDTPCFNGKGRLKTEAAFSDGLSAFLAIPVQTAFAFQFLYAAFPHLTCKAARRAESAVRCAAAAAHASSALQRTTHFPQTLKTACAAVRHALP